MKSIILNPVAKAINTLLKLDPESKGRIQRLNGKVVRVELLPLHLCFLCLFTDKGLELQDADEREAHTVITGTPLQMAGVMLQKSNRQKFFADDVKITGDAELGQQVVELFDELQIDWEEHASRIIGDVPTRHASQFLQKISRWLRDTEQSFSENISEYVHEEKQWLPSREALQDFFSDIDTLRMDADRMEARIKHMANANQSEEKQ